MPEFLVSLSHFSSFSAFKKELHCFIYQKIFGIWYSCVCMSNNTPMRNVWMRSTCMRECDVNRRGSPLYVNVHTADAGYTQVQNQCIYKRKTCRCVWIMYHESKRKRNAKIFGAKTASAEYIDRYVKWVVCIAGNARRRAPALSKHIGPCVYGRIYISYMLDHFFSL